MIMTWLVSVLYVVETSPVNKDGYLRHESETLEFRDDVVCFSCIYNIVCNSFLAICDYYILWVDFVFRMANNYCILKTW